MGFWLDLMSGSKIVKTTIVDNDSRKSATSGIARGLVGGVLLGGIGAIGGLASAKNKKETTFLVEYANGKRKVQKVKTGSSEYKRLVKHLDT